MNKWYLKVRDTDGLIIESRNTSEYHLQEGFVMHIVDTEMEATGTYKEGVYTKPVFTIEPWREAWYLADAELFGDDPKGIEFGSAGWMKCVRLGRIDKMKDECKMDIVEAYGL